MQMVWKKLAYTIRQPSKPIFVGIIFIRIFGHQN